MSTTKNNGGPAFPCKTERWDNDFGEDGGFVEDHEEGMTLRDYFAAKALQGWLAMYANDTRAGAPAPESAATIAYAYADAMLKAREQ